MINAPEAQGTMPDNGSPIICMRCGKNSAQDLHSCPYASEIGGVTDDQYCDCCGDCTEICAGDT